MSDLITLATLDAVARQLLDEKDTEIRSLKERVAELEAALAASEAERRELAQTVGELAADLDDFEGE